MTRNCASTVLSIAPGGHCLRHVRAGDELRCVDGRAGVSVVSGQGDWPALVAHRQWLAPHQAWRAPQEAWVQVVAHGTGPARVRHACLQQEGTRVPAPAVPPWWLRLAGWIRPTDRQPLQ